MTLTSFVWMLTECGHAIPLPPGTTGTDALSTGPVYELVLRAQPHIKLLYTHTPSSNVNAKASALAGHTVNGDACLVFNPTPSSFASPAVLLDSLMHPSTLKSNNAAKQNLPSLQRAAPDPYRSLAPSPAPLVPRAPSQGGTSAAAGPHRVQSPCAASQQVASSNVARQLQQPKQRQRWLHVHACPHQKMKAILGNRNAITATSMTTTATAGTTTTTATVPSTPSAVKSAGTTSITSSGGNSAADGIQDTAACSAAPTAISVPPHCSRRPSEEVEKPPCKSARSSGDFPSPWRVSASGTDPRVTTRPGAEPSIGGGEPIRSVSETQGQAAWPLDGVSDGLQGRRLPKPRLAGAQPPLVPIPTRHSEAAAPASMLMDDGEEAGWQLAGEQHAGAAEKMAGAEDYEDMYSVSKLGQPSRPRCGTQAATSAASDAAADVPWGDMSSDAVACIAMQLPQLGSQIQAMVAVCHGWRAALLGHLPLLRRVAFSLDLACPLRQAGQRLSTTTATAIARAATLTSLDQSTSLATLPATAQAGGGASRSSCPHSMSDHRPHAQSELSPLVAAMSRQHSRGAFLLPSHGSWQHDDEAGQQHKKQSGLGDGTQESGSRLGICPPATGPAPGIVALLRGGDRFKPQPLPGLLLAAAHASNPTAQLVLAQLLEASEDARGALRWWRKLAQTGDVMAMFKLGMASYDGSHGMQPDPESAHMWLGRTVRSILKVDSLSALSLDGHQGHSTNAAACRVGAGHQIASRSLTAHSLTALKETIAVLNAPHLHMLGWSSIVLGYLEFDGVAGRSVWGLGDRSEAVRLFRLADMCGLVEASAVLGWLYNTGQY